MVFLGFIAAWFFAASPMRRSLSVKETYDGVVKLPCSLATECKCQPLPFKKRLGPSKLTDFHIVSIIDGDAGIGRAWCKVNLLCFLNLSIDFAVLTKVNANGTVVNLVRHGWVLFLCASSKSERNEAKLKNAFENEKEKKSTQRLSSGRL